ncbi:MAG: MGMT family protein [Kiritimatiellia bacterium]
MAQVLDAAPLADRVYALLRRIPCGSVVTYGELARAAQCRSPRAIGQILRRNPHAPEVPCHRVIRSDLSLGGYSGAVCGPVAARKLQLLESEGVLFLNGRLKNAAQLWYFPSQF